MRRSLCLRLSTALTQGIPPPLSYQQPQPQPQPRATAASPGPGSIARQFFQDEEKRRASVDPHRRRRGQSLQNSESARTGAGAGVPGTSRSAMMYGVSAQTLRSHDVDAFVGECAAYCAGRRERIHMLRSPDEGASDESLLRNAGNALQEILKQNGAGENLRAVRAYIAVANLLTYGRRSVYPLPAGVLDSCVRVVNEGLADADASLAAVPTPQDVAALLLLVARYRPYSLPVAQGTVMQKKAMDAFCDMLEEPAGATDSGDIATLASASYVLLLCSEVTDKARHSAATATVAAALEKALLAASGAAGRIDFSAPMPACGASLSADEHLCMLSVLVSTAMQSGGFVRVAAAKVYFTGFAEILDIRGAALPTKLVTEFVHVLAKIGSPDAGLPMPRYLNAVLSFFDRLPAATEAAEAAEQRQKTTVSKHHAMRVGLSDIDQVVHNLAILKERWRRDKACTALCGKVQTLMLDLADHARPTHYKAALRLAHACRFVGTGASFLRVADVVLRSRSADAPCVTNFLRKGARRNDLAAHELFVETLQQSLAFIEEPRSMRSVVLSADVAAYKELLALLKKAGEDARGGGGPRRRPGKGDAKGGGVPILPSPFPTTLNGVLRVIADGFVYSPASLSFHKDNAEAVLGHVAAICAEETAQGRGGELPLLLSNVVKQLTRRRLDYPSLDAQCLARFVGLLAETAERAAEGTGGRRTLLLLLTATAGFVTAVQGAHPLPVPGLAGVELRVLRLLHAVVDEAYAAPPPPPPAGATAEVTAAARRLVIVADVAVARLVMTARSRRPQSEGGGFSCAGEEVVHDLLATQLVPRAVGGLLQGERSVVFAPQPHLRTEKALRSLASYAAGYLQSGLTCAPDLRHLFDDFAVAALLHTPDPLLVVALVPLMCVPRSVYTRSELPAKAQEGLHRCAAMLTSEIETSTVLSLSRVMTTIRQLAFSISRTHVKVLSPPSHAALRRVAQEPQSEVSDDLTKTMVHTLLAQMLPAESRLVFADLYPTLVTIAARKQLEPSTAASFVKFLEQAALTVDDDTDNLLGILAEILVGSTDAPPPQPDKNVLYSQVISGFVSAGLPHPKVYRRLEKMCLANLRRGIGVQHFDAERPHLVEAYASLALTSSSLPGVCGNPKQTFVEAADKVIR